MQDYKPCFRREVFGKLICQNMDSVCMHIALFLLSMNFSKNSNHFLFVCLFVYYVVVKMVTAFPIRLIL